MTPFLGPQPWEAPDPLPVMRRELKLLLIEMNLLRIEVEQSRSIREEAQAREAFFSASVSSPKAEINGDEKRNASAT